MTPELREGLAKEIALVFHQKGVAPFAIADAALAYLHAHDSHAEFVTRIRENVADIFNCADKGSLAERRAIKLLAICDAQLAKEQSK